MVSAALCILKIPMLYLELLGNFRDEKLTAFLNPVLSEFKKILFHPLARNYHMIIFILPSPLLLPGTLAVPKAPLRMSCVSSPHNFEACEV